MGAKWICWPKVFFPHRLSSFRNKRHILYPNYTLSFNKLSCECAIVILFPKYPFLFVYFYSDTKVTFRTNFSIPFPFLSLWNERHILFHSETNDTSNTPTIPFLSFKIIHFEAEKYLFSQWLIPFRLFHWCPNMCWKPKLNPTNSLSFTLKRKTLLLTWHYFLFICLFWCILFFNV